MSETQLLKEEVISKIETIEDKLLIKKINDFVDSLSNIPPIEDVYKEIKMQFGETLQKLAQ
jgi:hypothetical protein